MILALTTILKGDIYYSDSVIKFLNNKQKEDVDRIIYNKERKKKERIINEATKIRYIITENEDEALKAAKEFKESLVNNKNT